MLDSIKSTRRLVHLDMLRILAICMVVFNHTGERGYMLFSSEMGTLMYFPHMICSVICKIAVPVFFMISGALLLPKEESLKQLFTKRILRMVVVLLLISVPYYFWLHRSQGIGIFDFFTYIYGNSASTSLWYLYSYIGWLLLLPFLRSMVKNLKPKDYVYLMVGHVVLVGVLPCLEYFLWEGNVTLNESFSSVIFVSQNVFFSLMGYYLEHVLDQKYFHRKTVLLSVMFSVIAVGIICLVTYVQAVALGMCSVKQYEAYFNSFICIPAMTVYLLVKIAASNITGGIVTKVLSILGTSVFGVYLIEKIIRALTNMVYITLAPSIGSFAASLVWVLVICGTGFILIATLKHTPGLKKVVNWFI